MKGEKLQENLDYSFNWKDLICIDKAFQIYIRDREKMYTDLFCSDEEYTLDDVNDYIEFFMSGSASDSDIDDDQCKHHKYLWNLHDFLSKNYYFNLLVDYQEAVANISDCLYYFSKIEDESFVEEFINGEGDCIENLKTFWNDFLQMIASYPMLHLDKLKKTCIMGSEVYYDKSTQPFVLNSFLEFLQDVKRDFPMILQHFDRFLILDNDYLTFLAGNDESTQAFYSDNAIYLRATCENLDDPSEQFFYKQVLRHEFAHYVWQCLPLYLQLFWQENYVEWKKKSIKMCRDPEKNSQLDVYEQELFSDCMACWYFEDTEEIYNDDNYIHMPNEQIMDTFEFVLKKGFFENK